MPDPAALALIPVAGVIAAALIAGLFSLAGKRSDAQVAAAESAEQARRELVADQREHIAMLKEQVVALEAKVAKYEGRPTRGGTR